MKIDKNGQSSAEMILLLGGILVIIILISSYLTDISRKIENKLEILLNNERKFVLNKI